MSIYEPGWYPDLPMDEYLRIPAMSASGMEAFRRSPAHYRYEREHPKAATDAMREGTALHLALLEPEVYAGRYVSLRQCYGVKKDGARCSNQASVYRSTGPDNEAHYCGVHDPWKGEPMDSGIEVMSADALNRVEAMRLAVLEHPEAAEFFRGEGRSEVSGIWRDERTGVLCKLRLDREISRAAIHADVKTTRSAAADFFPRDAAKRGYHRKAAWYRRGMAALGKPAIASVLIAVESAPPHGCQMFLIDEEDLRKAGAPFDAMLARYAECEKTGRWPGYDAGFRHMTVPPWELDDAPAETDNDEMDEAA